ncbi:orotidine 5-phosphate decarboxylase [Sulfitobacter sp. F26204]|uniref:orotidine 5-phosphate decarboxylase n=1 Tax=Sulfitobacter sp. F26204 TaxID=2996014 RepID=UPI00225E42C3|nr:orotidine 5-phosphate decarboxylase [Sulfitobacter sp. F26204]MCX7557932.1 orotidine 5-phosphate decarboxylase [Sulfitobacter sp. F26204]
MYTCPIQLAEVRYNAASQQFEASVHVHDNTILRTYACAISAPISMPFEEAAKGLAKQAIRRHVSRGGLFSHSVALIRQNRAGRRSFEAMRWLENLVKRPTPKAA